MKLVLRVGLMICMNLSDICFSLPINEPFTRYMAESSEK